MALNAVAIRQTRLADHRVEWRERDVMLYALAVGFGRGDEPAELPFVFEGRGPFVVPTFAATLPPPLYPGDCGWDLAGVLHLAQELDIYSPLLPADVVSVDIAVQEVYDRPRGGVVIMTRAEARRTRDNRALFASTATWLARNDRCSDHSPPPPALSAHRMPERGPDFTDRQRVRPEQAALYRLLGDRNPLHIDPAAAAAGGFGEPVLHGLCTSGIACRSVLKTVCNYDPTLIKSLSQRFTAPVVAHDELLTEMWQDGAVISFRVSAVQRDTIVVDNGCAVLME